MSQFSTREKFGDRFIEALDETILTLKAMQKTWMLSGAVKEAQEEEKKKAEDKKEK